MAARAWVLLTLAAAAFGQTASLDGTITRPDGKPWAGRPVRLIAKAGGAELRTATGADGSYRFVRVAPGEYRIDVPTPCCAFVRVTRDIAVTADKPGKLDIRLAITLNGATLGDDPSLGAELLRGRAKLPTGPVPRLNGKPDLSGVWVISDDPFPETPKLVPELAARVAAGLPAKDSPHNRCLPGAPPTPGAAGIFLTKFVHTRSLLVILFEDVPGFRQVFLDGRPHPRDWDPTFLGHSVGRWEGDTLVVDTVGFNDRGWMGGLGGGAFPHSEQLHVVERYTRPSYGRLDLKVIFDDPGALAAPLTANMRLDLTPQEELTEFVCENNKPEHLR